jgi:hypothetical protein
MYEHRSNRPLPTRQFLLRLLGHGGVLLLLVLASLAVGMAGYIAFERLAPLDAFLNAAMLLGGMGPVDPPRTSAGKLFAGLYALYSGLLFLIAAGLVLAPVMHRVLHKFHWDDSSAFPLQAVRRRKRRSSIAAATASPSPKPAQTPTAPQPSGKPDSQPSGSATSQ